MNRIYNIPRNIRKFNYAIRRELSLITKKEALYYLCLGIASAIGGYLLLLKVVGN